MRMGDEYGWDNFPRITQKPVNFLHPPPTRSLGQHKKLHLLRFDKRTGTTAAPAYVYTDVE